MSKEIPTYPDGETFHGHRFDIDVGSVSLTTEDPAGYGEADAGEIFLVAHVDVTNVSNEATGPTPLSTDNIILENGKYDDVFGPSIVFADDGTTNPELNPGMPRSIDLVWTVPEMAFSAGDTAHFTLYDSIPRPGFVLHGTVWIDLFEAGTAERQVTE